MKRHRARLSQANRRRALFGAIALGAVAAFRLFSADAYHLARGSPPATIPSAVGDEIASAAESVVPYSRTARPPQLTADGTYQASLIDKNDQCWKVQVAVAERVASPVGQATLVGCWEQPIRTPTPAGTADRPDPATDRAARGFLSAYLTGGDVTRWGKPGVRFDQPKPLVHGGYGLADSHQSNQWVTVNGWVDTYVGDGSDNIARVDVTWLLTMVESDIGPVVGFVNAGPPPPHQASTNDTTPPTTAPPQPTTTTSTSTTTTTTIPVPAPVSSGEPPPAE